ncbi:MULTISPECIES: hypothetical protein [Acidithiobacillus]|uniref:Uncharacterized protein n=2 Tax=Acidithiobacillus TaxID=119977 RepID=A0ACD5HQ03_9PROT|nr:MULTISPECIES: hypothetical protein [Acidithiobacillus]MBU2861867.1 hypothetical protein [Acidithiobacillus ferrooxidans]
MDMPEDVRDTFGYALHLAQIGDKHPKPDMDRIRERLKWAEQHAKGVIE